MEIVSSYGVEILNKDVFRYFAKTKEYYNTALSWMIQFFAPRIDEINAAGDNAVEVKSYAESLIHSTEQNKADCDFDVVFPCMPSYLRRSCISDALGCINSWKSNYANWECDGRHGKAPRLGITRHSAPSFYRKVMYDETKCPLIAKLKVYDGKSWIWVKVFLRKTDVNYLNRYWSTVASSAPTLEKKHRKWFLRFAFKEYVKLPKVKIQDQRVCAVDLGINKDAVCNIMLADGTVVARKFIDFPAEKDCLWRVTNRVRKLQREHGNRNNGAVGRMWAFARRLNIEIAKRIANAITGFAVENKADVIVFEYLDMKGKKHGKKKQKLTLWRKNDIQKRVEHSAHRHGIRISHICAWGTSKLAFDGSGEIYRGRKNLTEDELKELNELRAAKKQLPKWKDCREGTTTNKEVCTFTTGKEYNADLAASYNIGARYFVREMLNSVSAKKKAKAIKAVPSCEKATMRTLATLRAVYPCLYGSKKRNARKAVAAAA